MADTKSKFKRPEQATPVLGPDAESFIRGTPTTPEAVRTEPAPEPVEAKRADQAEASPTKAEPMKRLTIDIPLSLHKRVKSRCADQGTTIADVVRSYLERKFPEAKS